MKINGVVESLRQDATLSDAIRYADNVAEECFEEPWKDDDNMAWIMIVHAFQAGRNFDPKEHGER
jgi:hypothetical protein